VAAEVDSKSQSRTERPGDRARWGHSDLAALKIDRSAAPKSRSRRWIAIPVALAAIAAAALWLALTSTPLVTVAYAQRSAEQAVPAAEVLTGSGYVVTADRYISLGVRVPARIVEYLVEEGQSVQQGETLVRLDSRQYEAALSESRAALASARANAELRKRELVRTRELRERSAASDADLDLKRNQVAVSEAEIARLEAQIRRQLVDLEDTVIRAPTSGMILEKLKEVGEIAVPGGFQGSGDLIRMANLEDLRVELDVNESDLGQITLDQPARVIPEAYPERSYDARVVKLYPQINRQKGTLKVEARILTPDSWLRPDMSVRITFLAPAVSSAPDGDRADSGPPTGETPGAVVLVPRAAVRREQGGTFAWVVTQGRARRQPLEIAGPGPGDSLIVTSGLAGGEATVIDEATDLREGQAVEIKR